jgi:hypothetical protein
MAGDRRYGTIQWKRLRKAILLRDAYTCQVAGPKCLVRASTVDHITPIILGGDFWSPQNLRASCRACNYASGTHIRDTVAEIVAELRRRSPSSRRRTPTSARPSLATRTPAPRPRPYYLRRPPRSTRGLMARLPHFNPFDDGSGWRVRLRLQVGCPRWQGRKV